MASGKGRFQRNAYRPDRGIVEVENHLRAELVRRDAQAISPAKRNRILHMPHDAEACKCRHLIENYFIKIKEFRVVNTRYDKTDTSYRATWNIAATMIALR